MKRAWSSTAYEGGTDDSRRLALALAEIADDEFIQSVIDVKTLLDRVGGQAYIAAYRQKFDSDGHPIEKGVGEFRTLGYLYHYQHIAEVAKQTEAEPNVTVEAAADEAPPPIVENGATAAA